MDTVKGLMHFLLSVAGLAMGASCTSTTAETGQQRRADCCCMDMVSLPASEAERLTTMQGALLGTRFTSFAELQQVTCIEYFNNEHAEAKRLPRRAGVRIRHCHNGHCTESELRGGVDQGELMELKEGTRGEQLGLLLRAPFAVAHRKDLERIYILARLRPNLFGAGDAAFYDLAVASFRNISTPELAFRMPRDTSEKGYINTFNHITAQALITTCFSEALADFVADAHERFHHPELIHGQFTSAQIQDLEEGPVDNYVDLINNEVGQELGKALKAKYGISRRTRWTPQLLANYLNDLQHFYGQAFHIGFEPFRAEDAVVVRFAEKINQVMRRHSFTQ